MTLQRHQTRARNLLAVPLQSFLPPIHPITGSPADEDLNNLGGSLHMLEIAEVGPDRVREVLLAFFQIGQFEFFKQFFIRIC